jgi:sugar lactone lactonase YvrE
VFFGSVQAKAQIITTIAGDGNFGYSGDGFLASYGRFNKPASVVLDDSQNVYIADYNNQCIRKINIYGYMTTICGSGGHSGMTGDGGPASKAKLYYPSSLALDRKGNLYIADSWNNRIRKIDKQGIITTVAGSGNLGSNEDTASVLALKANMYHPAGVAVDNNGNLYIADYGNSTIRKVDTSGMMTTFAGKSGKTSFFGENIPATSAILNRPSYVAVAPNGDVYIADSYNNRIRKVNALGIISTAVGAGLPTYGGDSGPAKIAQLNFPMGITFDRAGNLFVADCNNNRIRKIDTAGTISSIVGDGRPGYIGVIGDGGNSTDAQTASPLAVAADSSGNLYLTDKANYLRYVYVGAINEEPMTVFPCPGRDQTSIILASSYEEIATIQVFDVEGKRLSSVEAATNRVTSIHFDVPGSYYLVGLSKHKRWTGKAIILH